MIPDPRREAREARAEVESGLEANGWPWSVTISRWLDLLIVIEARVES